MAAKVDAAEKTNTLDPKRVEKIVKKIEDEHEALLSERMSYMSKCKPYRERIAHHYEEGIGFGIPKKILKAKIRERALQREIDGIPDDFEDDDRSMFDQVSQALGEYADTPLGRAATDKAKSDDDRDLRPRHLQQGDADRAAAAANSEKLSAGIKPLN